MDTSDLAKRMKMYEKCTPQLIPSLMPLVVRLDGRSFSKFTKGMDRPFDGNFHAAMVDLTKYLVDQTNAKVGYTQSDEISLLYANTDYKSDHIFGGRKQKIESVLAGLAASFFVLQAQKYWPEKLEGDRRMLPHLDARAIALPNVTEAYNCILWRERDATKNSIQMLGQANFSHEQLKKKSGNDVQHMLITEKGVNWNDLAAWQKRGTYVQRRSVERILSDAEYLNIPEKHRPVSNVVVRSKLIELDMPPLTRCPNAIAVFCHQQDPQFAKELTLTDVRAQFSGAPTTIDELHTEAVSTINRTSSAMGVPAELLGNTDPSTSSTADLIRANGDYE